MSLLNASAIVVLAFMLTACADESGEKQPNSRNESTKQENKARFEKWAYVAKEKEIAPGETLKLVVIPNSDGEFFDTKCLIYTNATTNTSTLSCPAADGMLLSENAE
jgi:hypothetical protein